MADDQRIAELLEELLDSHSTPEAVCATCPELLPEVIERWRKLRGVRAEIDAFFPPLSEENGEAPQFGLDGPALPEIPGYEVEAVLGRGGMGVVFRARQLRLNRTVALKMTLAGAYAGRRVRGHFQREAEAVAALRHPNIVQIHDVGEAGGQPYFAMEYVEGGSLARRLAGRPQAPREAAALLATLAEAVHAAHLGGIVHRDLKPVNILLTGDGTPKISDFGLALRLDGGVRVTRTSAAMGTPGYMAPEQARGDRSAGSSVDIYALGAILYELLTGRPPFQAASAAETVQQVIALDPVPPSKLNPKIPRDLETICLKCLFKEPLLRYATAAELAEDLRRFVQGEAILARPEGRLARTARQVRRRPVFSAAIATSALLMVVMGCCGIWFYSERAAQARAARADLDEMTEFLGKASWFEARAALERAKGRLGNGASPELLRRSESVAGELELGIRLDVIVINGAVDPTGAIKDFEKAFADAGLFRLGEDPAAAAKRIRESNIRRSLVEALDSWTLCADYLGRAEYQAWLLDVTRRADPDPGGWRDRLRDPDVRKVKEKLTALAQSANLEKTPVNLLLTLGQLLLASKGEGMPIIEEVNRRFPQHLLANMLLGLHAKHPSEAIRYDQAALAVRPKTAILYHNLGVSLCLDNRFAEATHYFRDAIRLDPRGAPFHAGLASTYAETGQEQKALAEIELGLSLKPNVETFRTLQARLRGILLKQGRWDEARIAWRNDIGTNFAGYPNWYGYAELCLFLGKEEDYREARRELLARFGAASDPQNAERVGRACLLLPASEAELEKAAALADRAAAADKSKYPGSYPFFRFAQGLADYRRGHFDRAIDAMRGEASRVFGPGPRLVLSMALHKNGKAAEARKELAEAIASHDWRRESVRDQDDWIFHVLRREAERMILPELPDFLAEKYRPQDNDRRLALVGVCQFEDRNLALARLYYASFAADKRILPNRLLAALRAAALAGCGRGSDADPLEKTELRNWRIQARLSLRNYFGDYNRRFNEATPQRRREIGKEFRQVLTDLQSDPALAGLRDPVELDKLPPDERKDCLALWAEVRALLENTNSVK